MKQLLSTKKIGIFRALQLGDMLCSVPALRAIRTYYPHSSITLIGLAWAQEFAQRFSHLVDHFIPFPGFPGLPEQPYKTNKILGFIKYMQNEKLDLLLQMHGDGSIVNPLMQILGAKQTAGFYRNGNYCPNPRTFIASPTNTSEIEKLLLLTQFLHIPPQGTTLEFPIFENEKYILYSYPFFKDLKSKPFICIHSGARNPKRRWNPLYFAYVADKLAESGFSIVFTGTKKELPLIQQVVSYMKQPAIICAGQLPLGATAQLIKHAQLLISNCTSVVHIADALHIPTITIYLSSSPQQWAPLDRATHKQISGKGSRSPLDVLEKAYKVLFSQQQSLPTMKGAYA